MKRVFLLLLAATALFLVPIKVQAANNGELVQAVGDSKVYYIEGVLKRHIADHDTFQAWGFNAGLIRKISKAELNNHPTGPKMTRVIMWGGTVYYVENGTRRYVPSGQALSYYGHSFAELSLLNTDTFFRLPEGSELDSPHFVRVPGDNRVFYLDGATRRPFKSDTVNWDYVIDKNTVPESAAAKNLPIGPTLTNLVNHNGTVWVVMGRKRFYITSQAMLDYNQISWGDLSNIDDYLASILPEGGNLRPPALVTTPGSSKIWLVDDNGARRWVTSTDTMYNWGYHEDNVHTLPNSVVNKYPEVSTLSRFVRHGSDNYYIIDGQHKRIVDHTQEEAFGLNGSDLVDIGDMALSATSDGGVLAAGLTDLEGYSIPATSGKTGREQHLYLNKSESELGQGGAASKHYADSSTPSAAQNGMAGGYGSFGSEFSPPSVDQERYYINMRWNYCYWYEENGTTKCRNLDMTSKNWHRHKKVIVINPANGRQLVASVEESGPAIWTNRVSGLSPEAMNELGAVTNDNLSYYWAANQDLSLGRLR